MSGHLRAVGVGSIQGHQGHHQGWVSPGKPRFWLLVLLLHFEQQFPSQQGEVLGLDGGQEERVMGGHGWVLRADPIWHSRNYVTVGYYSALKRKEMLTHTTTWINLEDMMPNEISQTKRPNTP